MTDVSYPDELEVVVGEEAASEAAGDGGLASPVMKDAEPRTPKEEAGYQESPSGDESCGGCAHFYRDSTGAGKCEVVEGKVLEDHWCELWHDPDSDNADHKSDGAWTYEEGPEGGDRWVRGDEVRYRRPAGAEAAPSEDDDEDTGESVTAADLEEGDEVVIDGEEAEVSRKSDMGGGFYIAGRTDDDEVVTARVGPNEEFGVATTDDDKNDFEVDPGEFDFIEGTKDSMLRFGEVAIEDLDADDRLDGASLNELDTDTTSAEYLPEAMDPAVRLEDANGNRAFVQLTDNENAGMRDYFDDNVSPRVEAGETLAPDEWDRLEEGDEVSGTTGEFAPVEGEITDLDADEDMFAEGDRVIAIDTDMGVQKIGSDSHGEVEVLDTAGEADTDKSDEIDLGPVQGDFVKLEDRDGNEVTGAVREITDQGRPVVQTANGQTRYPRPEDLEITDTEVSVNSNWSAAHDSVPKPPDEVLEGWAKGHADEILEEAEHHDMEPDEYVEALDEAYSDVIGESEAAVRVPTPVIEDILDDGRLKSQFETGTSGGWLDNSKRSNFEDDYLGVDRDVDDEDRPIYGYATGPDAGFDDEPSDLAGYGDASIRLSDDAKERGTVTFGDSLSANEHQVKDGDDPTFVPTPAADPSAGSVEPGNFPVGHDEETQLELMENADDASDLSMYTEMQLHGQVTTDDFEEVVFETNPGPEMREKLDEAGVDYTIEDVIPE